MSSQTQPQKVQVALLTILSSVMRDPLASTRGRGRNVQLPANALHRASVDLAVSFNRGLKILARVQDDGVAAAFSEDDTAMLPQMLHEFLTLHEVLSARKR